MNDLEDWKFESMLLIEECGKILQLMCGNLYAEGIELDKMCV